MRTPAYLALPGAGTCLGVVAGAVEELSKVFVFQGFAGTSGGGLCAAAYAYGMAPEAVSAMISAMVVRQDLLDIGIPLFQGNGTGIYRGNVVANLLKQTFGEKTRMGDLLFPCRLTASSLWIKRPGVVDNKRHPDVFVWAAARATMSIEEVFDAVRLRENDARLYGDGGAGLNVPAGIWDDKIDVPTVSVRFRDQSPAHDLNELMAAIDPGSFSADAEPVRNALDVASSTKNILMGASAAAFPCRKPKELFFEVVLDIDADSLKFGISPAEAARRRQAGILSAKRALAALAV